MEVKVSIALEPADVRIKKALTQLEEFRKQKIPRQKEQWEDLQKANKVAKK